ncbi:MAG: hypothetical protein ACI4QT_07770 [Kiritimatiellia bacterium]
MTGISAQILAVVLAATWCGFGLYGIARICHLSPHVRPENKIPLLAIFVAAVAIGGTKPKTQGLSSMRQRLTTEAIAEKPAFAPVEIRTKDIGFRTESASAVEIEDWRKHGSASGGVWLDFGQPFFKMGTNLVSRVYVTANGTISFFSMRRPPIGSKLPDGTGLPSLAPLLAPLGMIPEAYWSKTGAASRFWHDLLPGNGRVFTWENALLDRSPGRRVSFQAELHPSGDFTFRYNFTDALEPPATNFVIGAQFETFGANALAHLGTNPFSAIVWRLNGECITNGVSIADVLYSNGVLQTPVQFAIKWKNTFGIVPNTDTDTDGLSDWHETFLFDTDPNLADTDGDGFDDAAELHAGTNPLDSDENGDGIPDGISPGDWTSHQLWGEIAGETNIVLSLDTPLPAGQSATLLLGNLAIPLKSPRSWNLRIPEGPATPFELRTMNGTGVSLSLSEPATGARAPIHLNDPDNVFRISPSPSPRSVAPSGASIGGSGHLCVFDVRFVDYDTGNSVPENTCIHDESGTRRLTLQFSDSTHSGMTPTWSSPAMCDIPGWIELSVSDRPGDTDTAFVTYTSPQLICGSKSLTASIHRCEGGRLDWCYACGMLHGATDPHACPHQDGCPAKTDGLPSCTCPIPVVRVSGTGTSLSENTVIDFPSEAFCCCSRSSLFTYARLTHIDSNLAIWEQIAPSNWVDAAQCPNAVTIYATAESGSVPSEISYELVRRHYGEDGSVVSNEVFGTRTQKIWAVQIRHEPVTTDDINGFSVNPSGIVLGHDARFRFSIEPSEFPSNLVSWSASPRNRISFPYGNFGTEVIVRGENLGEATLISRILGYAGPPVICNAAVVSETVVPIHAFIICDVNGEPAANDATILANINEVNGIYSQVGIKFNVVSFESITNQTWLFVSKNSSGIWPLFYDIVSYTNRCGGFEMYFTKTIQSANGLTNPSGIVIANSANANTIAHELGHAQKLKDVYAKSPDMSLTLTGMVHRIRLPNDWGTSSNEGYYPSGLSQSALVSRLLMYGHGPANKRDLPSGDIDAVWRDSPSHSFSATNAPTGFFLHAAPRSTNN